jgi:hypothetical protein
MKVEFSATGRLVTISPPTWYVHHDASKGISNINVDEAHDFEDFSSFTLMLMLIYSARDVRSRYETFNV